MEQTATTDTGTAEAQSNDVDPFSQPDSQDVGAQADKPASNPARKAAELKKILEKEKNDPDVKFTDKELDILDEHYAGKLKPAKTKPQEKPIEDDEPDENPVSEPMEEDAPEQNDEDEDDDAEAPDPDAESLMKEVGAKNLKEALAKVKDLRKQLGGKDAQAVARLTKEKDELVNSASKLWSDVKDGRPDALAFVEKNFGFKAVPIGQQPSRTTPTNHDPDSPFIDPEQFIDPESAELVNSAFMRMKQELDTLKSVANEFQSEKENLRQSAAKQTAELAVVDEMVQVAQRMDGLKSIPNLREAINAFYKGAADKRLEPFNELFQIAEKEGCNLQAAFAIKRGMEADRLIAEAEERGKKAAYAHKPNPSLSGTQGGKGESTYQPLSDQQIEAMAEDHTLMPDDWFDKDENPIQSKIPKKAWGLFGFR